MKSRRLRKYRKRHTSAIILCLQIAVVCLLISSLLMKGIKINNSEGERELLQTKIETRAVLPVQEADGELAQEMDSLLISNDYQGVALLVQEGAPVLHKAYGYADLTKERANTVNSLFPIGSIQKNLTALLVMKAVEDKKLSLSTKLNAILPDLKDAEKYSIADLLSMTTGYQTDNKTLNTANLSEGAYLEFILNHLKIINYPGTWSYQPANYFILAMVLRKIYHEDYRTLLKNYVKENKIDLSFFQEFDASADTTFSQNESGEMKKHISYVFTREVGTGEVSMTASALYRLVEKEFQQTFMSSENFNAMITSLGNQNYVSGLYHLKEYIHLHGVIANFEVMVYMTTDTKNALILSCNKHDSQIMDDLQNQGLLSRILHVSGGVIR